MNKKVGYKIHLTKMIKTMKIKAKHHVFFIRKFHKYQD